MFNLLMESMSWPEGIALAAMWIAVAVIGWAFMKYQ